MEQVHKGKPKQSLGQGAQQGSHNRVQFTTTCNDWISIAGTAAGQEATLAVSKPSEKSMISQICSRSGTTIVTGLNRAFKLSGSSVRPAYPGFMVIKIPVRSSRAISFPAPYQQCVTFALPA